MHFVIDYMYSLRRDSLLCLSCLLENIPTVSSFPSATSFTQSPAYSTWVRHRSYDTVGPLREVPCISAQLDFSLVQRLNMFGFHVLGNSVPARYMSHSSIELKTDNDVVRFSIGVGGNNDGPRNKGKKKTKRVKMSKKAKVNELRFYRLKAKKKMTSPNPEVRIRYKLEKVKHCPVYLFFLK
jgi:hypothetical protein